MASQREYYPFGTPLPYFGPSQETENTYRAEAAVEMTGMAIGLAGGIVQSVIEQRKAEASKKRADEKLAEQVSGMADLIETIAVFEKAYREMRRDYEYEANESTQKREYQIITILLTNLIILKKQIKSNDEASKKLSEEDLKAFHTALKQVCHTTPFHDFLESLQKVLIRVACGMLILLALVACYLVFVVLLAFSGHVGLLAFLPIAGIIAAVTTSFLLIGLAACGLMGYLDTRNGPFQLDQSAFPVLAEKSSVIDQALNSLLETLKDASTEGQQELDSKKDAFGENLVGKGIKIVNNIRKDTSHAQDFSAKAPYFSYQHVFQQVVSAKFDNKAKEPTSTVFLSSEEATQLANNKIKAC